MADVKNIRNESNGVINALFKELEDLKTNGRRKVMERLKAARLLGDLSDNPEYDAAKEEQFRIEQRIDEIEDILKRMNVG